MKIDWPKEPTRKPTKKELARYNKWVTYLKDSRLSTSEVYSRAAQFAASGKDPRD